MELTQFPKCCGTVILHHLTTLDENKKKLSREEFKNTLRRLLTECKYMKYGTVMAITNPDQQEEAADLEMEGFKTIYKFINPITFSELQVWVRELRTFKPIIDNPFPNTSYLELRKLNGLSDN